MKIILLLLVLVFYGCDIQKKTIESDTSRKTSEQTETITKRVGDTVSFKIPKITYKDTTIYTVNRQGTTLRTVYDNSGQISQIDCFASMIEEINRSNKLFIEAIKEKDQEKSEVFKPQHFIYSIAVLAGIILIGFIFVAYKIQRPI